MINNFVLIIGAMKCGTTSLFNYLAEHPQIAACSYKESSFFSKKAMFAKGLNYYQSLWNNWNPSVHKLAMEASTSYTRKTNPNYVNAAENIAKFKSEANFKFIYIMRDPLKRIESHYTHLLLLEPEILDRDTNTIVSIDPEVIETSKYAMQIKEYYKRFDSSNILLLNFEELKTNPGKLLKEVCEFLEIDNSYNFQQLDKIHNSKTQQRRVYIPGWYSISHTLLVKALRKRIPPKLKSLFRSLFGAEINNFKALSSAEQDLIANELSKDLNELNSKYKFNLSKWNIKL